MSLLDGIKVIDLASFLAGPGAATLMADYGATVIKVEPPGGDGYRRLHGRHRVDYNWQLTSRHKQGLALDITREEGRAVLTRLLADADVLLTNFREDQRRKFKLGYDDLKEQFPRLVYAQITGFGSAGPESHKPAYDATTWWARSGIMQLMKGYDQAPEFPAGGVGDHASAMTLFAGIMMALYRRQTSGKGGQVETSLLANGCWANGMSLQGAIAGYDIAKIMHSRRLERSAFSRLYQTADDRYIILVLTNLAKEWPLLAKALGHPEWVDDERFPDIRALMKRRVELAGMIADEIGSKSLAENCQALDAHPLTYGVIQGLTDVVQDAQLIENGLVVPTQSVDPDFQWTLANPIKISGETPLPINDPPECGEHTESLLLAAGYSEDEVASLLKAKVVFSSNTVNED